MKRVALVAALAVAGCGSGFGVGVTIDPGCVTQAATLAVSVRLDPSQQSSATTIDGKTFFSGERRVVVVPPDGTTDLVISVDAFDAASNLLGSGTVTVTVDGHQLLELTLTLGSCGGGGDGSVADLAVPDLSRRDGPLADLISLPDLAPSCNDIPCPPGMLCTNNVCVPGCDKSHGCSDGGMCNLDAGMCGCSKNSDCGGILFCCGGVCIDPTRDPKHCGGCNTDCMGLSCCASACVDQTTNKNNCGGCGVACVLGNGANGVQCAQSKCKVTSCQAGLADCDGVYANGCEIDTQGNPSNCNGCGTSCATAMWSNVASYNCIGGACGIKSCVGSFQNCDQNKLTGCEVDVSSSSTHCGGCSNNCNTTVGPHVVGLACVANSCTITACDPNTADCDLLFMDGCEITTSSDEFNCNACGKSCLALSNVVGASCIAGSCQNLACAQNYANCDNDNSNGCETYLLGNQSCGSCGNDCSQVNLPNATGAACFNNNNVGVCWETGCKPGFGDCDGNGGNGCETNTDGDANNCGMCSNRCSVDFPMAPNVQGWSCGAGKCIPSCAPKTGDCDNNLFDGCEANFLVDAMNCNGCGNLCPLQNYCDAGACAPNHPCPQPQCITVTDGATGSKAVTCGPGTCGMGGHLRISAMGSGTFHVDQICRSFGYMGALNVFGDCVTCGGCPAIAGTCAVPLMGGPMNMPLCQNDDTGRICTGQISWICM